MNAKNQTRNTYPAKQIYVELLRFFAVALTIAFLLFSTMPLKTEAAAGMLDTTFGTGGKITSNFGGDEIAYAVALQPDGKIIAAGTSAMASFPDFYDCTLQQ